MYMQKMYLKQKLQHYLFKTLCLKTLEIFIPYMNVLMEQVP